MATRRIFWGFCRNWFGIGSLHYISSRSDLGFVFAEIFVIDKNAYRYNFFKPLIDDSPTRWVMELATPRLAESGSRRLSDSPSFSFKHSKADSPTRRAVSRRLPDSPSRRVSDSLTRRVGESPIRRLTESGSRFSIMNISANSKPKAERLER